MTVLCLSFAATSLPDIFNHFGGEAGGDSLPPTCHPRDTWKKSEKLWQAVHETWLCLHEQSNCGTIVNHESQKISFGSFSVVPSKENQTVFSKTFPDDERLILETTDLEESIVFIFAFWVVPKISLTHTHPGWFFKAGKSDLKQGHSNHWLKWFPIKADPNNQFNPNFSSSWTTTHSDRSIQLLKYINLQPNGAFTLSGAVYFLSNVAVIHSFLFLYDITLQKPLRSRNKGLFQTDTSITLKVAWALGAPDPQVYAYLCPIPFVMPTPLSH